MKAYRSPSLPWVTWISAALLCAGLTVRSWALTVKPGVRIVTAKAGSTIKVTYDVVNDQGGPIIVRPRIRDSFVLPENKAYHATNWVTPQFQEETIPVGKTRKVTFKVRVPVSAKGELAALLSIVPDAEQDHTAAATSKGIQTRIVTMITVSLYVRVQGTEIGEADVLESRVVSHPAQGQAKPMIEATVAVKNTGNIHQRPSGHFEILPKEGGAPLYQMDFPVGWPVMPQTQYLYSAHTDGVLPPGQYQLKTRVTFAPTVMAQKKTLFTVDAQGNTTDYMELP